MENPFIWIRTWKRHIGWLVLKKKNWDLIYSTAAVLNIAECFSLDVQIFLLLFKFSLQQLPDPPEHLRSSPWVSWGVCMARAVLAHSCGWERQSCTCLSLLLQRAWGSALPEVGTARTALINAIFGALAYIVSWTNNQMVLSYCVSVAFPGPGNNNQLWTWKLFFFFLSKFSSLISVLWESVMCHFCTLTVAMFLYVYQLLSYFCFEADL